MKPKKRQKLCQNCEGEIDLDVIVCPFCAADLREEKPERQRSFYASASPSKNLNEALHGFESLYPNPHAQKPLEEEPPEESASLVMEEKEEGSKRSWLPIFLLTLGVQFFLIGFLTLIFSYEGSVVLKWSARYWFIYLFASLPLIVFGYKYLEKQ